MVSAMAATACKSKKHAASASSSSTSSSTNTTASMTAATGATTGKVSHKYRSAGCATVIVFMKDGTEVTLIPKDKLAGEFDVDGLEITFNYHPLKMPNPEGCTVGMPAEITELAKK